MMFKKLFLIISFFALVMPFSMAQHRGTCGTISAEDRAAITKRLLKNKAAIANGFVQQKNDITWVPVKFHLIADNNGNGRISETSVFDQLCKINTAFADQDIQFFIEDGFSLLNSTPAFESPSSTGGQLQLQARKKTGMINIYICKNADTGGGSLGTTLGFYSPFSDWIVIRKDEVSGFNTTLIHEIGHFLGLLHPHNGWDAVAYDEGIHGNPAPNISPGGTPTENEDRTGNCQNCNTAGDFICDTPPDYNFGFGANSCDYIAGTKDPCDVTVNPTEALYMSYFLDDCQTEFSTDQKALRAADLAQRRTMGTISQNFVPDNVLALGGQTTLEFPADGGIIETFNYVTFDWTEVENADGYVFELDRTNGFNFQPVFEFVTDGSSSFQATGLNANTNYFWRVTPYNQSSTCVGTTTIHTFTTGNMESTAVPTITSVNNWSVQPNPVRNGSDITIKLETSTSFDADIKLYDITGKLVKSIQGNHFATGASTLNLAIDNLNNGMYVIAIHSDKGVLNNKIVISK